MKLAEALILRADIQKRIEQIKQRITRNAKVQEGEQPAEDPNKLLIELQELAEQWMKLVQQINKTNNVTSYDDSLNLVDAIAIRDKLKMLQNVYLSLAKEATITQTRYSKSEVRFKSSVKVANIQKKADELAKEYRIVDTAIQTLNWNTDLIE